MKEFNFVGTFHGIEKELDKYKMSTKNHGGLGTEILETDVMEITAYTATPDMDIGLSENQIKEIDNKRRIRERITGKSTPQQEYTI